MVAKRTKIVCTIGPSVNNPETISRLIKAGMNAARLNFSHGSHEDHQKVVDMLKVVRKELNVPLTLMLDTKGPEVRLGVLSEEILVAQGDCLELVEEKEYKSGTPGVLPLATSGVLQDFVEGGSILIDDGYLVAVSRIRNDKRVFLEFMNAGKIRSRKSLNVPQVKLSLPAITDKDREDLFFAIRNNMDWIAASFIRSADHVLEIKRFLRQNGGRHIQVAAKIENQEGVDRFDEILRVSDGIMVARGDLGVEVPISQVPRLQKMMIRKACQAGKPVITATQMLESMIQNPRPTRAEVSDVANAIYDSTSAVMLSGETAVGKYPVETVEMMSRIIQEAEKDFDYERHFLSQSECSGVDVTSCVAMAAVKTALASGAKAIFCVTDTGRTAKLLSCYRPRMHLLANTTDEKVFHQLALCWGVEPVITGNSVKMEEAFCKMAQVSLDRKWVEVGDLVLMTSGNPFGVSGMTNVMMIECIGDVLVSAKKGVGSRVQGKVMPWLEDKRPSVIKDHILLIHQFTPDMEGNLGGVKGVVMDNSSDDFQSEEELLACASRLNIPVITGAKGAIDVLHEGMWIKLEPSRGLVFHSKEST